MQKKKQKKKQSEGDELKKEVIEVLKELRTALAKSKKKI